MDTGLNPEAKFALHDSIWGTNVPDEFKHASTGAKVAWGLSPWVGEGKNDHDPNSDSDSLDGMDTYA